MSGTNLLPRHRVDARRLQRCLSNWVGVLCTASLLVGGGLLAAIVTRAQPPAMPAGLTERAETLESELAAARAEIEQIHASQRAQERAAASLRWDPLLDIIAQAAGPDVRLRSIHVQPIRGTPPSWSLALAGDARTKQQAVDLASGLDATGLFDRVGHAIIPASGVDGRPGFSIDCVIAPKPAEGETP